MLPDVQPSSETSFCTSPLSTDTSATTEHPVTAHEDEVSHKLDHEAADSPRLDQDDSTLSCQHPNEIRDDYRLSPEGPSDTSAPLPPSCTEDTETLATGLQGECLRQFHVRCIYYSLCGIISEFDLIEWFRR